MMVHELLVAKNSMVVTVGPTATLAEAARTMVDHRIGALVVTDDAERLLGIISERDVAHGLAEHGNELLDMPVAEVMTR